MNKCAFDFGEECSALNGKQCEGCSFHKTKEQLKVGRDRAEAVDTIAAILNNDGQKT